MSVHRSLQEAAEGLTAVQIQTALMVAGVDPTGGLEDLPESFVEPVRSMLLALRGTRARVLTAPARGSVEPAGPQIAPHQAPLDAESRARVDELNAARNHGHAAFEAARSRFEAAQAAAAVPRGQTQAERDAEFWVAAAMPVRAAAAAGSAGRES